MYVVFEVMDDGKKYSRFNSEFEDKCVDWINNHKDIAMYTGKLVVENPDVRYRLEVDYLSKDYDDSAIGYSSPIYSIDDGIKEYNEAILEKCVDDDTKNARVHLWEYVWSGKPWHSEMTEKTIMKNY